jgi:hydroxymethylglutaryl-CoA reductase
MLYYSSEGGINNLRLKKHPFCKKYYKNNAGNPAIEDIERIRISSTLLSEALKQKRVYKNISACENSIGKMAIPGRIALQQRVSNNGLKNFLLPGPNV